MLFTAHIIVGFNVTVVGAIVGSVILGIVNATIRPVILLLTLPLNLLTLGLFALIINGLTLLKPMWLAKDGCLVVFVQKVSYQHLPGATEYPTQLV